jgi:hypothetical protein
LRNYVQFNHNKWYLQTSNSVEKEESLFIYKLAKVNKTQTHENYFAFLLLFLTVNLLAQAEKPTRIYLVRHAEKITSNLKDHDPC